MKRYLTMVHCALLVTGIFISCSGGSDANDIAKSLEDRLTDALEFEGGAVKNGLPPEGNDAAEAPQITQVIGNDLRLEGSVGFLLFSDFEQAETVDKAIVFVRDATRYIEISGDLSGGLFTLIGILRGDETLRGKDFEIQFALQTKAGQTGQYRSFEVKIIDADPLAADPLACSWSCAQTCSTDQICAPEQGQAEPQCRQSCEGKANYNLRTLQNFAQRMDCTVVFSDLLCRYQCGKSATQVQVDYFKSCLNGPINPDFLAQISPYRDDICGLASEIKNGGNFQITCL